VKLSRASIAVLVIQFFIVSTIAAKYLYQRWTCPHAWTRAVAYDPSLVMRGRYISAQIYVDACGVSLPDRARFASVRPHDVVLYEKHGVGIPYLNARIADKNGRLAVLSLVDDESSDSRNQRISIRNGSTCSDAFLQQPIDFYLSETAKSPFPLAKGQQMWVDVTVPPKGPPRPLGLALKDADGSWHPLDYR
jgi:hypothetical protein